MTDPQHFHFRNLAITLMPPNAAEYCTGTGADPADAYPTGCPMMSTCAPPTTACLRGYSVLLTTAPESEDVLRELLDDLRGLVSSRGEIDFLMATRDQDNFDRIAAQLDTWQARESA